MTNKEVEINFNKLEKEVKKAVNADDKYWRENSAKLRAIEQRVPTYEDFRQIVLASNLRPLDKGETIRSGTTNKIWNSTAFNSDIKTLEIKDTYQILPKKPKTSKEILKIWKNFDENNSKWEFLEKSSDDLKEIIKSECNSDFLGELIFFFDNYLTTSNHIFEVQKLNLIVDFLDQFSKSRRFELSIMFLTEKTKFSLNRVFQLSRQFFEKNQSLIENLDILYKVYFK